jgi:hypothetical protein
MVFVCEELRGVKVALRDANMVSISLVNLLNNEIAWEETQYLTKSEY